MPAAAAQETDFHFPLAFKDVFRPKRYKILHGGRGGAKSWTVARALVVYALQTKHRILCAREFQASIKDSAKQLLTDQIEDMGFSDYFDIARDQITCRTTGTVFLFAGLWRNPQKIKSMEGITLCWVEEANTVSQESLDFLLPTIRTDDSEIWFTFNRRDEKDPVDKMFLAGDVDRDDTLIIYANYDANPWFPKVLEAEMAYDKAHDYDKYRHVWLGEPVKHSEALVFSRKWRIDGSIKATEDDVFYFGADWGFSVDPSTLVRMWVNHEKREIYIDHEAYGVGIEIDALPTLFDAVPGSRDWIITADCARPETISYMKRQGFNIRGSKKGAGSVEEGVNFLKSYIIVVHPRCKHVIDELSLYSWKVDKHTGDILPKLEDDHNHMIDAMRYAIEKLTFKQRDIGVRIL